MLVSLSSPALFRLRPACDGAVSDGKRCCRYGKPVAWWNGSAPVRVLGQQGAKAVPEGAGVSGFGQWADGFEAERVRRAARGRWA
ncbi:hypothetical protein [Streptomyces bauhiniae]|uniref:Uncharacterized protein n=1 Tax=Streptomyces bauhiniae TaxID=2340725 RepID=A0A7K3R063_9ACTN|nr:hypothetical protein [Streptomyces bauhiniae]NEB95549.1 hypothetical protein [Streptomyces bauhiniae]